MEMKDRIRQRRKQLGLSIEKVASQIFHLDGKRLSRPSVNDWELGNTRPSGYSLLQLAKVLMVTPDWIQTGEGDVSDNTTVRLTETVRRVPLISWVQAGAWTDTCTPATLSDYSDWVSTTANVSQGSFALTVRGDSMQRADGKSIPEGAKIIVDPQFDPAHLAGKVVVAMLDGGNEATVKELVIDGPNRYLVPWNPRYHPIPIDGNCRIVGVVKQVMMDL